MLRRVKGLGVSGFGSLVSGMIRECDTSTCRRQGRILRVGTDCCISSIIPVHESPGQGPISGHPNPDFLWASSLPNPRARPKSQIFRSQFLFTWLTDTQASLNPIARLTNRVEATADQPCKHASSARIFAGFRSRCTTFAPSESGRKLRMRMQITVQVIVRVAVGTYVEGY